LAEYREYGVQAADRRPLLQFMLDALRGNGCTIIHEPAANLAPFKITFETPSGERMGIIAYAFTANSTRTRNRPEDEHRFQMKYGSERENGRRRLHDLWHDPYGLYTTLLVGIDVERDVFVGADPMLHNPTKLFISVEFKRAHVTAIQTDGWYTWERVRRPQDDDREASKRSRSRYWWVAPGIRFYDMSGLNGRPMARTRVIANY
jgi:hypothetical protein